MIAWLNAWRAVPTILRSWPGFRHKPLCVSTASLRARGPDVVELGAMAVGTVILLWSLSTKCGFASCPAA